MRELHELFDLGVKARSLAYLFLAGAGLGVLTLVFPHSDLVRDRELVILAAVATALSVVMYVLADRLKEWQLHAFLATGTVILTLANYFVEATVLYPVMYTWTALYAFYFFRLPVALAHVALIAVGYGIVMIVIEPDSAVIRWLLAVGTPLIAGLLISRLLMRLRSEGLSAEERARAVQRSEARTRLVLDSAPDAFVAIDPDGLVNSWNAASERLFGWSAAEAIGKPLRSLIFPDHEREAYDERRRILLEAPEAVKVMRVESELQRRDGSVFPAERTISRVRIGPEIVMTAFLRDIGDRRRAEREREQLVREQAARAEAERTTAMVSGMQLLVDAALRHRTLGDILDDLVVRVRSVLDADAATIFLAEDRASLVIAASSGGPAVDERPAPIPFGEYFAGRVALSQEAQLAHNPDPADIADPSMRAMEIDSLIGVPLTAEGEIAGVLTVCATAPHHFREEDLGLLRLAADRVALAISHARVYEREHRIAETLQRSLLPDKLPKLPGLDVEARYLPAAAEAEVGGDWYDVIPLARGGVGLVMGDVAGKGLAAASMVGQLRSALRAYAFENHDPSTVVEQLNRLVWAEADDSQMATLLYAVIDPAESAVRWVNAGHPAPLLVAGEAEPLFLEGGSSVPLGVLPFPTYGEVSARMDPDSTILLYTDGLVERPGEHIDQGMARLAAGVGAAPREPGPLLDHLIGTLVPAAGAPDDIALLALRNMPVSDRFSAEFPTQPESLARMRELLRRWLGHAGGSPHEIAEITTACGEAATNAIEHAGVGGPFQVSGVLVEREVEITVQDYGEWRAAREGDQGRGLALMRALMDTVEVTPTPEGTTVRIRRALTG